MQFLAQRIGEQHQRRGARLDAAVAKHHHFRPPRGSPVTACARLDMPAIALTAAQEAVPFERAQRQVQRGTTDLELLAQLAF